MTATIVETGSKSVGMGQIVPGRQPGCLTAILGSCIGVTFYHERLQLGVLGHVVLPDSNGQGTNPGKFADTAIPHMIELLKQHGIGPGELDAKITGGACMFGSDGPMQIGDANVKAVVEALKTAEVSIAGKDTGGSAGRRISFDCTTGLLTIDTVGNPSKML